MENRETLKTPYNWCLELNLRVLDINEWPLEWYGSKEKHFFEYPTMVKSEFLEALCQCRVKPNSLQRKTDMYLEYRMYGLVAYQLCGTIHAGIQFGHAVVEYGRNTKDLGQPERIYNQWADNDKTFIILNGGTTNNNPDKLGSLNQHYNLITEKTRTAFFCEPDLGDQLTAFVFLVDERVWNRELYPDFIPVDYHAASFDENIELERYTKWVTSIGGNVNVFLRDYLKNLRLA